MKLTPHERDVLYNAIREPIVEFRVRICASAFLKKSIKESYDYQLFKLEKDIWAKICADLPDCLVGETGPIKDDLARQTLELCANKED